MLMHLAFVHGVKKGHINKDTCKDLLDHLEKSTKYKDDMKQELVLRLQALVNNWDSASKFMTMTWDIMNLPQN